MKPRALGKKQEGLWSPGHHGASSRAPCTTGTRGPFEGGQFCWQDPLPYLTNSAHWPFSMAHTANCSNLNWPDTSHPSGITDPALLRISNSSLFPRGLGKGFSGQPLKQNYSQGLYESREPRTRTQFMSDGLSTYILKEAILPPREWKLTLGREENLLFFMYKIHTLHLWY